MSSPLCCYCQVMAREYWHKRTHSCRRLVLESTRQVFATSLRIKKTRGGDVFINRSCSNERVNDCCKSVEYCGQSLINLFRRDHSFGTKAFFLKIKKNFLRVLFRRGFWRMLDD
ncbi:hypothetical protein TNIN_439051 [Trichonephila inaurata madagascariensis]|uniref:Uncharacterized protein n=1 Tax=Trichonephila inaurata madagascariensis TaxID=2747483 RepID=A0A8X6YKT7_9ARAC|nr:hypothetical protein TNIN_439051 [Trichonephila inaurata madagascariensis]